MEQSSTGFHVWQQNVHVDKNASCSGLFIDREIYCIFIAVLTLILMLEFRELLWCAWKDLACVLKDHIFMKYILINAAAMTCYRMCVGNAICIMTHAHDAGNLGRESPLPQEGRGRPTDRTISHRALVYRSFFFLVLYHFSCWDCLYAPR